VLPKDKTFPEHQVPSPITIHCISGKVELVTTRARQMLTAGQLVYLPANDPHSLQAFDDSIILLTIAIR
jgi:quercetin dioxygenase-like cupin family protein